jgi:glucose/arabinose dehydrogenase
MRSSAFALMLMLLMMLSGLVACGDNTHRPVDDDAVLRPECYRRGTWIRPRRIAWGCGIEGAPLAPGCIEGTASTLVTSPPGDPRLFVLELHGRIRIIEDGVLRPAPFLDISPDAGGPVNANGLGELGFLGLAFHPRYAINRQFFVFYTMDNPDPMDVMHPYLNVLVRYTTSATDPYRADPASAVTLLSIPDPFSNHNGGMLEFGPDGLLYVSTGDGGGVASLPPDPYNHAQNPSSLLGKILRLDVDDKLPGLEYGIPAGNPFAASGGRPEVLVLGLRNPWRFAIDRSNGDLYIGDVGGAIYEEITVLRYGQQAGRNLGWKTWEGPDCHAPPCDPTGMTFPQDARHHSTGYWSIIPGEVYRGACYPDLVGMFIYVDTGYNLPQGARLQADGSLAVQELSTEYVFQPASLHADSRGELYETDVQGSVWELVVVDPP